MDAVAVPHASVEGHGGQLGRGLGGLAWTQGAASSAATLLLCDAWFDVMTSQTSHELGVALVMAVLAEGPLALLCIWVARNSERVSAWAQANAADRSG